MRWMRAPVATKMVPTRRQRAALVVVGMTGMVVVSVVVVIVGMTGMVVVTVVVVRVAATMAVELLGLAAHSELGHQLLRRSRTPAKMRRQYDGVVRHTVVRPHLSHPGATVNGDPGKWREAQRAPRQWVMDHWCGSLHAEPIATATAAVHPLGDFLCVALPPATATNARVAIDVLQRRAEVTLMTSRM